MNHLEYSNMRYKDLFLQSMEYLKYPEVCNLSDESFNALKYDIDQVDFEPNAALFDIVSQLVLVELSPEKELKNKKGLCAHICFTGVEAYSYIANSNCVYITSGKILINNKDPYCTQRKEDYINQFLSDQKIYGKAVCGGYSHVWLTFDNGYVLDPTILMSRQNLPKPKAIYGMPEELYQKYQIKYIPYIVNGLSDLSIVKEKAPVESFSDEEFFLMIKYLVSLKRSNN